MSDMPKSVSINEEGPREGFQIESGDIPTARKVELIDALAGTGLKHMQIVSFVNPKRVPGMADAEAVVQGIAPDSGVDYTALWLNEKGLERTVGAIRERYPELRLNLHLHDTRGMAIANTFAGLEMGVASFDASVAGLGGCPFAGHKGAAGNICTEDLVFMCNEMGIETGIDLDRLIGCASLAEDIVGHPLPGSVKLGGSLDKLRASVH